MHAHMDYQELPVAVLKRGKKCPAGRGLGLPRHPLRQQSQQAVLALPLAELWWCLVCCNACRKQAV